MNSTAGSSLFPSILSLATRAAMAAFWLALAPLGHGMAASQSPHVDACQDRAPMGNKYFADVTTRGRITERFEIYNPHSEEQLETVKGMGFTQVILDRPYLHAAAAKIGLDVVMANWWTMETGIQVIEKSVEYAERVDPRRLVAVSMMDEPERYAPDTPFSYYQSLYQDLRAHFDAELPGVKLEISHWGPLPSWTLDDYKAFIPLYQATDRIRIMPYPDLYEGPLSEVYYQMVRSRWLMQLAGRDLPQVVILQAWVLPERAELPTIDELRVMFYQAILAGADTLSLFSYDPELWRRTPGFTEGLADLMHELTDFSRRYGKASVESRMSQDGLLTAVIRPSAGQPISILVNTNRVSVAGLAPLAVCVRAPRCWAVTECSTGWRVFPGRRLATGRFLRLLRQRRRCP